MASTSDSDDFASADEDLNEDVKPLCNIPSLKSACEQELVKHQPKDTTLPVSDVSLEPQLEVGSSASVDEHKFEVPTVAEPVIERKRRQQKCREVKVGSGPKKLGTKILSTTIPAQPVDADKQSMTEKPEVDPYAKFRGFSSEPPIMQRCWFTNPQTGEVIVDNNVNKVMSRADVITNETAASASNTDPDPYAKFRGYSEPPLIERCWEEGVDDVITENKPIENVTTEEVKVPEQASSTVVPDPYAKFRGYSEPPLIERCWEEGVDDVITENKPIENVTTEEVKVPEQASSTVIPDPYAKFRGYSEPPLIERCWEEGVDDVITENKPIENVTTEEVKVPEQASSTVVPDPYAKFRGYSEPPLIERCWEEGVDDVAYAQLGNSQKEETQANFAPVLDKLTQSADSSSGWGSWSNWSVGVTSLLSSASEGVSTLTNQVTSALESSIGVPTPEEMAQAQHEKKLLTEIKSPEPESPEEHSTGMFGFGQLMSNVTKLVETTGSKVLSGGLDTLETIGKKTMEVLQEGDPGLKKKRAMFTDKTVLSQVLREAKEKAETESRQLKDKQTTRAIHFETLFDDYQGLVHLEALEMLSKQCGMKLQALLLANSGAALAAWQAKLQGMKDACQLPDDEDMPDESNSDPAEEWRTKLAQAEKALGVPIATDKLDSIWKETGECMAAREGEGTQEIYEKAVTMLARLTAIAVEQFHKGAELLLVQDTRRPVDEAEALIT